MAALVGDAVQNGRQTIPDMPQVVIPPTIVTGSDIGGTGGLLPIGAYYVVATARTNWGESSPSPEMGPFTKTSAGDVLEVRVMVPFGATFMRVYYTISGGVSGTEQQYIDTAVTASQWGTEINLFDLVQSAAGIPPTLNRAFLPDTDGNLIGAATIFGWLNDGLKIISRESGGLLDYCGVQSQLNQPLYTVPGEWNEITSVWYDGYWMMGGDRGQFWRRNNITSQVLSAASISVINNQNVLEVYPQPARTAASTTLAAPMAATDTAANLTNAAGFVLPFGFMQVDSEIMAYAVINGNQMTGLIRGLGGSAAVAHLASAPVLELNIFWSGKRQLSPAYMPGNSMSVLPLPSGWEVILAQYIGGRAKVIEHDLQSWDALTKSVQTSVKSWMQMNRGVLRRRQVGGNFGPKTYYSDIAGGILIN